jgi:hypothetical protein
VWQTDAVSKEEMRRHPIENRYLIAAGLIVVAATAILLALTQSPWLWFAAVPPALGAVMCCAPRSWLSSTSYRRTINFLAYASLIPAAIALAAAIGLVTVAIIALPAAATFVIVTRMSGSPAPR